MANPLNLTLAKFVMNREKMFLHDPAVYIKFLGISDVWYPLGYMEMDKEFAAKQEYAKFSTGIPSTLIRQDVIGQEFSLSGSLKQLQPETIALLSNRKIDRTSEANVARVLFGTAVPPVQFVAVDLVTQTVDGVEVRLRLRYAQLKTEELKVILGGKEHGKYPFSLDALRDDDPLGHNPTWPYLGKKTITGTLTSADATVSSISFGTVDDILVGGRIYGVSGIPADTTILSVDYSAMTLEMSANATGSASAQTITVQTDDEYADYDNVAFFQFAEPAA